MLDFTALDPEEFELLCEDLLRALGFIIDSRPGRGPDKGKDILATRQYTDLLGNSEEERYLVECKHFAKSGKSVRESDIGNFLAKLSVHRANRYLLITSTVPSETVRDQLTSVSLDPTTPYKAGFWARNDLNRFLEQHPLIRARYFAPMVPSGELAASLARELVSWVQLAGYSVKTEFAIDKAKNGFVGLKSPTNHKTLAYCVGGEATVRELRTAATLGRRRKAIETWVVALSRIAPSASEEAERIGVKTFILSDLITTLLRNYQRRFLEMVNAASILERYVEVGCEKPTFSSRGTVLAVDQHESVTRYINSWVSEPTSSHLLLLGQFGVGKTWILMRYTTLQLEDVLKNPTGRRLPIYLALSKLRSDESLLGQISNLLEEDYSLPVSEVALDALNREGRLVFFLDGFDELGTERDDESILRNIRSLESLLVGRSKILLSSRDHFFSSQWKAQALFSQIKKDKNEGNLQQFEVMSLSTTVVGFNPVQMQQALEKRLGASGKVLFKRMREVYDAFDLGRRPLLLGILADIFESGVNFSSNIYDIYRGYTEISFRREYAKGVARSLLGPLDRKQVITDFAWHMFIHGRTSMPFTEMKIFAKGYWSQQTAMEELDYELRTASFLVRDATGEYRFAHKSFFEYFVASWILESLQTGNYECLDYVSHKGAVFSPEIDSFIKAATELSPNLFAPLSAIVKGPRSVAARRILDLSNRKPRAVGLITSPTTSP